jgi:sialate O-acetylesterase
MKIMNGNKMMKRVAVVLMMGCAVVQAELRMSPVFSDGMVLQRDMPVLVWGEADPGTKVTVNFAGQKKSGVASEGGQWRVMLDPMKASSKPRALIIRSSIGNQQSEIGNVLVGEVWLAGGQSNMAFHMGGLRDVQKRLPAKSNPQLRFIQIPVTEFGEINREGLTWKVADKESVRDFSAVAYFFAAELQKRLGVPVGIIGSYRGGTWNENWMTPESIKGEPKLKYLFDKYDEEYGKFKDEAEYEEAFQKYLIDLEEWVAKGGWSYGMVPFAPTGPKAYQRPAGLYECMIKPLQPYTIKGVIWYQGEGNSGRYEEFRTLFPAFVEGWRKTWGNPELPFYFVQLPPYKAATWPHFRQAQLDCSEAIPNCGMVVSEGCGDLEDIHPRVKKPIGDRLAIAVSAEVYGQQHLPYGPAFESVEFRDGKAGLRFRYAEGGLELSAEPDGAFEIAGADKVFVSADVELKGPALLLWNDAVKHPAYVRYAYSPYPNMVLFNQEGLPASPFTTERSD